MSYGVRLQAQSSLEVADSGVGCTLMVIGLRSAKSVSASNSSEVHPPRVTSLLKRAGRSQVRPSSRRERLRSLELRPCAHLRGFRRAAPQFLEDVETLSSFVNTEELSRSVLICNMHSLGQKLQLCAVILAWRVVHLPWCGRDSGSIWFSNRK
jgi:hypothetical protein